MESATVAFALLQLYTNTIIERFWAKSRFHPRETMASISKQYTMGTRTRFFPWSDLHPCENIRNLNVFSPFYPNVWSVQLPSETSVQLPGPQNNHEQLEKICCIRLVPCIAEKPTNWSVIYLLTSASHWQRFWFIMITFSHLWTPGPTIKPCDFVFNMVPLNFCQHFSSAGTPQALNKETSTTSISLILERLNQQHVNHVGLESIKHPKGFQWNKDCQLCSASSAWGPAPSSEALLLPTISVQVEPWPQERAKAKLSPLWAKQPGGRQTRRWPEGHTSAVRWNASGGPVDTEL